MNQRVGIVMEEYTAQREWTPLENLSESWVWSGTQMLQKRSIGRTVVKRNHYPQGFREYTGTVSAPYFYTKDHLGSIRELVRGDGTTIESRIDYDPWGVKISEVGPSGTEEDLEVKSDFTYTGHYRPEYFDDMVLAMYRAYMPEIGRWISRDPIGEMGGLNLYGYVSNNPTNLIDFLGLEVDATFNVDTRIFTVKDRDTGESASMRAYSGGNPFGDPIPYGSYDILDYPDNDKFRLESNDENYGDDKHDVTGRTVFRLHKPGRSIGCITAEGADQWSTVRDLIRKTKTSEVTVKSKSRSPFASSNEQIKKFETLTVIGTQK